MKNPRLGNRGGDFRAAQTLGSGGDGGGLFCFYGNPMLDDVLGEFEEELRGKLRIEAFDQISKRVVEVPLWVLLPSV